MGRKKRRNSTNSVGGRPSKYQNKYKNLKKKLKAQTSKIKDYQDKITNIQDNAEETEDALKRKYELKLLHVETKYLKIKNEKNSLQHENERLKQQLFMNQMELKRTSISANSGYSTNTVNTPIISPMSPHRFSQSPRTQRISIISNN